MKTLVCALLGMAASAAYAVGGDHTSSDHQQNQGQGQAQVQGQQQLQGQGQIQGQDQTATTGDQSVSNVGNTAINSKVRVPYQAPGVYSGAPRSTAPMLKCIGFGGSGAGSNGAGGAAVGWCWIVRSQYYEQQAVKLLNHGFVEESAVARCMEKIQWRPFGSKQKCIDSWVETYNWEPPEEDMIPTTQCDEKLARCEATVVK